MIKILHFTKFYCNLISGCKLIIISCLFIHCSDSSRDKPTDGITDCIVTNKAKLEEIAIFPSDNPINSDISQSPADPHSDDIIALLGSPSVHPDFGSGLWDGAPIGLPFILVCREQSKIPVTFRQNSYDGNYGDESDPGPFPVPLTAPIEGNGNGDSHVLAVDIDNRILYELYNASAGDQSWNVSSGAVWDLKINATRPRGWTSADAAGMPILPLLVRYEEVSTGTIDHAIRFTLSKSKVTHGYILPANHLVNGTNSNPDAPTPMGMRIRLKTGFDISGYSPNNQVILTAMKKFGMILTDIGSDLYISGAPDERWDNDDLSQLKNIKATDFEVLEMGEITYN